MVEVIDLGEFGDGFRTDPHPVYARLRAEGPVHRVRLQKPDAHHETWLVVGHEEARAALADPRLLKDGKQDRGDLPPGQWLPGVLIRGVRSLPVRW